MEEELLSMEEAIERLKTTRPTFYRWLRSGRIKGLKVGRQWRFYPADLERFLQGEQPRIDLPLGIGPLLAELGLQLQELDQPVLEVAETADGALERMLQLAVALRSDSLHLEPVYLAPGQQQAVLRCRIDGQLQILAEFDRRLLPPLIEQAKLRSHCDPHQHEQPQEGQFYYESAQTGSGIDLRTVFLPTGLGESLSARLLNRSLAETVSLERIQLPEAVLVQLQKSLRRGWGMIVASGPTGSGKTTTLYAALNELAGPTLKCFALEDPIELYFPWVTSLPGRSGQSFSELLKATMQADPDVLLVAELRDAESLQQALHIALTGHLVLTTLHTSDAIGSLLRLVEVSGNAYSVTESLNLILNQRLVRRLCQACRQAMPVGSEPAALTRLLAEQGLTANGHFWHAPGCSQCQTGYRGRLQLTEALTLSPALNAALIAQAPAAELRRIWLAEGGQSWLADGLARALTGDTSPEELLRANGLQ